MSEEVEHHPTEMDSSHDHEIAATLQAHVERFFPGRYPYVNRERFDGVALPTDADHPGKLLILGGSEMQDASQFTEISSLVFIIRGTPNPDDVLTPTPGFAINYYNSPEPSVTPSIRVRGTTVYAPGQKNWEENDVDLALEKTRIFQEGIIIDEEFENQPFGWNTDENRVIPLKEVISARQVELKKAKPFKKQVQLSWPNPDRSILRLFQTDIYAAQSLVLARVSRQPTYTALDGNTYSVEAIAQHLSTQTELGAQTLITELVRMEAYEGLLKRMKLL